MATASASSSGEKKRKRIDHLLIGKDDFDEIIEENAAFIDKTMFIKEWMENPAGVSVILLPRRFGKSTNLSMLKSFFSFNAQSKDFSRFLIGKETEFIKKHCGKYPVVFLNMKGIGGDNWEEMFSRIWSCLRKTLEQQDTYIDEHDIERMGFGTKGLPNETPETIAAGFLDQLTSRLKKKCNERVIVLIDEYDAPLNHAFRKGFYDKASSFFGEFYSNGLKGNFALKRACLMGIVEIRGTGMLSGLNNLVIYSSADEEFSQYFGFTKKEISDFLDGDEKRIEDVMEWYNGYYMGTDQVINPWSFMNYIDKGKLKSYWVQTASIDSIRTIINPALSVKLIEILGKLYDGNEYEVGELSTKVNYDEEADIDSILAFLVHAGYLTFREEKVLIPNQEIKYEWRDHVLGLTSRRIVKSDFQRPVISVFSAEPFDIKSLETVMRDILIKCSYHDLRSENSYHLFYFGIFLIACGGSKVSSNKETGHGRYDIEIAFHELKRVFIFEFKVSKDDHDLEKDAKGLKQIHEKKYYQDEQYVGWTCFAIGVSFFKKQMSNLEYEELKV